MTFSRYYELKPTNGYKSFHGKAMVMVLENGSKMLISEKKHIMEETKNGELFFLYDIDMVTRTISNHIKSFCGLSKKEVALLPTKCYLDALQLNSFI